MPSVFVDGQHGTAGLRLGALLRGHPLIDPIELPHDERRNTDRRRVCMAEADLLALCLPANAVAEALALAPAGSRVIDASNAHRCSGDWVYGLPELCPPQRTAIRSASRVTNPGCFAAAFILAVRPLVDAHLTPAQAALHCYAITGYSAGGARMIARYERGNDAARMCSLDLDHRHLPEMRQYTGLETPPVFIPSIGNHAHGMHLAVPLAAPTPRDTLLDVFRTHYESEPFIRVIDAAPTRLTPAHASNTNDVEIHLSGQPGRYLVSVRLHNLMKGAAGSMVQNMNLMLGLEETAGLT